jgi:hypothetical protein
LTLLLRARGVPARLVTGFSGADWNPIGRFYSVRERTAHSWTEAFLDGEWVTLDATPGANDPGTAPRPSALALVVDTLRARWHRYVIGYDLSTQGEIALAMWRYWRSRPAGSSAVLPRLTKALPAAVLVLAVVGVVLYRLRRRSAKRPSVGTTPRKQRAAQREATRLLALLERHLKKLGFPRPAARTPLEHVKTIHDHSPVLAKGAISIIERYNEVRFGKVAFLEGEPRRLAGQIRHLAADHRE